MLILVEGDVEWQKEDQAHLAVPADPNCPDLTQPGKTWIGQFVNGMYSCPSPLSLDTIVLTHLVTEARKAMVARGSDVFQAMQLIDHGLWDHPAIDPDSCGVIASFVPVGAWPQSEYSFPRSVPILRILQLHLYMICNATALNRCKP